MHVIVYTLTIVVSDFEQAGQITLVPGGPDEITTQLQVEADRTFENDETFLLSFSLAPAAVDSGARIGARNESRVTIINDDSKIHHYTIVAS